MRRADYHSRFRGNDGTSALDVIPAKAGIHAALNEDSHVIAGMVPKFPVRQRGQVS